MRSVTSFVSFAALICAAPTANAIVIDDFTVGPVHLERNAGVGVPLLQTGLDPAHVLGGQRDIVLGANYNNGQVLEIDTIESQLTLTSAPSPALAGLDLTYGSRTSPLGVNLTAEGHDRFVLDFDVIGTCCNDLRVSSVLGSVVSVDGVSLTGYYNGRVAIVPFSEFSGVDFTNVASIELDFGRNRGMVLQSIYTIPEPICAVMLTLIAFGVIGAGGRCRWRQVLYYHQF